jgi:type VI secretion system protein ImpH
MPAPKWRHQSSLIHQLIYQPQRFQYFQAVHLIDRWLRRAAPAHGRTLDTVLRFKNSVSLAFPASQIEALSVDAEVPVYGEPALPHALDQRQLRHIRLTPAFMGFLGVNGVLPYVYTDTIAAQIHFDKNEGGRAFFDSFSHRSMTLFYRAWEKCHVEYRVDDKGRDGFLPIQLALAGKAAARAGAATVNAAEGGIADEVAAHYAALIRHRPLPAEVIAGVLSEYFCLPFRLEQFVRAREIQPPEERTRLDAKRFQLGVNTMLGPGYWRRDLCVRLWIGPLSRADFDRFFPIGSGGKALKSMLALFAVPSVRFEVRLILRAQDVTPVALDFRSRLGYGTFLLNRPATGDEHSTRYYLTF